jgi:hypothetical protein
MENYCYALVNAFFPQAQVFDWEQAAQYSIEPWNITK